MKSFLSIGHCPAQDADTFAQDFITVSEENRNGRKATSLVPRYASGSLLITHTLSRKLLLKAILHLKVQWVTNSPGEGPAATLGGR